ncbi:MarR family transcriptional regulator [Blautia producta]
MLYYFCCSDKGFTQNDLSDLWSIPKQTISFAITGLIKKEYVHF